MKLSHVVPCCPMLRGTQLDKEATIVPSDSRSFSSDLQLVGMFSSSQKSHETRDFMSPKCRPVLWSNIVQRQAKGRLKQSSSVVLADLSASLQFSANLGVQICVQSIWATNVRGNRIYQTYPGHFNQPAIAQCCKVLQNFYNPVGFAHQNLD